MATGSSSNGHGALRHLTPSEASKARRPSILFLTGHLPFPPISGGRLREFHLLSRLRARADIHLCVVSKTYEQDVRNVAALEGRCTRVEIFPATAPSTERALPSQVARHASAAMSQRVAEILRTGTTDLVHVEGFYMMQHVPGDSQIPVLLVEQNVEYALWRQRAVTATRASERIRYLRDYLKTVHEEIATWERADMCAAVTSDDVEAILAARPRIRVRLAPDGVDHLQGMLSPVAREPAPPSIVYVANFCYEPNLDAARFLCREIWPAIRARVPDARLMLVGNGSPEDDLGFTLPDGVVTTGRVEDVAPYLQSATLVVCPLRIGGGVKVKVLEALYAGKALVTTPIGVQGLRDAGRCCLVADSPRAFADAVVNVLRDAVLRHSLEGLAAAYARSLPTWDEAAEALFACYEELVGSVATEPILRRPRTPLTSTS